MRIIARLLFSSSSCSLLFFLDLSLSLSLSLSLCEIQNKPSVEEATISPRGPPMAADVSTLVRLLSRYDRDEGGGGGGGGVEGNPEADIVTRDLLGGCCVVGGGAVPAPAPRKVPFPGLHVLPGGEKRLQTMDLNLPPLWSFPPPPHVRAAALDTSAPALNLGPRSLAAAPPAEYQSVCTLEKVKSALERAERESRRRRQRDGSASPVSSSTTTSSAKRRLGGGGSGEEGEGESGSPPEPEPGVAKRDAAAGWAGGGGAAAEMAAAGCPSCLLYVLISRSNPRCPRCSSAVPLPPPLPQAVGKKPRIDLNAGTSSAAVAAAVTSPIRTLKFF